MEIIVDAKGTSEGGCRDMSIIKVDITRDRLRGDGLGGVSPGGVCEGGRVGGG